MYLLIFTFKSKIFNSFQLNEGFTEEETYKLFATSLNCSVNDLKKIPEARTISDLCKGHPMLINLMGTLFKQYKDDILSGNCERWSHYIDVLSKKDQEQLSQIFGALELSLKELTPEQRSLYEDLVVFVEDVNITPEVLKILWNKELFQVGDIMQEFQHKSLAVYYYNQGMGKYIYGIHDLCLAVLKHRMSKKDIIARHKKLVMSYLEACSGNFSQLPDDNYIFLYIGHHLLEANMLDMFEIYFDLLFIEAKIKAAGVADVLRDFELYWIPITQKNVRII